MGIIIIMLWIISASMAQCEMLFDPSFQFTSSNWNNIYHADEESKIKGQNNTNMKKNYYRMPKVEREKEHKYNKNQTKKSGSVSSEKPMFEDFFFNEDFPHPLSDKRLERGSEMFTTSPPQQSPSFSFRKLQTISPENDFCTNAGSVTDFVLGTTIGSSIDNLGNVCSTGSSSFGVWYTTQGTGTRMTANTCSSNTDFDTKLSIFQGTCSSLSCVASNDDDSSCGRGGQQSLVTWNSSKSETYIILVYGFSDEVGNFRLTITSEANPTPLPSSTPTSTPSRKPTFSPSPGPTLAPSRKPTFSPSPEPTDSPNSPIPTPDNDICTNAVSVLGAVRGTTIGASIDNLGFRCGVGSSNYGVWYTTLGTGTKMTADTCSGVTDYDTKLSVFQGTCSSLLCIASNDNESSCGRGGKQSLVAWNSTNGAIYTILVHGSPGARGNFRLAISSEPTPTPPPTLMPVLSPTLMPEPTASPSSFVQTLAGDSCATAESVSSVAQGKTTDMSTGDVGNGCGVGGSSNSGSWYTVQGTGGRMTANTCSSQTNFDTIISVFRGTCSALSCVEFNDDSSCGRNSKLSLVSWMSTRFETYTILVHGFLGESGNFQLQITSEQSPTPSPSVSPIQGPAGASHNNDLCVNADTILTSKNGTTVGATMDDLGDLCDAGEVSFGVWYTTKGTGGRMTVDTCDNRTNFDTKLSVFKGDCWSLSCVGYDDDGCGQGLRRSLISWNSTKDEVYWILVHGFLGRTGDFGLSISSGKPPSTTQPRPEEDVTASISSDKSNYILGEFIVVTFSNDLPFNDDLVGIYEVHNDSYPSTFAIGNLTDWKFACGTTLCSQAIMSGSVVFRNRTINPGLYRPILQRKFGNSLAVGAIFEVVGDDVPTQAPTPDLSFAMLMSDTTFVCPSLYENSALRGDECCNPRTEKRQCEEKDFCFGLMLSHPDAKFSACCEHYSSCEQSRNLLTTLDKLLRQSQIDFAFSLFAGIFVTLKFCMSLFDDETCYFYTSFVCLMLFEVGCFIVEIVILVTVTRSGAVETAQQIIDAGCFTGTSDGQLIGNVIDELETYFNLAIGELILSFLLLIVHCVDVIKKDECNEYKCFLTSVGLLMDWAELVLAGLSLFLYLIPAVDAYNGLYSTLEESPNSDLFADGKTSLPCVFACCGSLIE